MKIVDSRPFQRLRNIKQLATTYLVYHGAEHTRFGHSLGVAHLVSQAFRSAVSNYRAETGEDLFRDVDARWYEQILRLIALVHDLGHAPFSHASEALFDKDLEHEDFTNLIIHETEIAGLIEEIGDTFCRENGVGESYKITPDLLWLIYGEKKPESDQRYLDRITDFKFLKSFMDSELDCDKMDYLLRDSYYCGVNYGRYDLGRLIDSLTVYANKKQQIKQLAIQRGGIHAFEEFVIARYFMFIQVYYHKTRRYLDKLLVNCVSEMLNGEKYPRDVNAYLALDDEVVIRWIAEHAAVSRSAADFLNRNVMSCVYETRAHANRNTNSLDLQVYGMVKQAIRSRLPGCTIDEDEASKVAHKIPLLEPYDADSGKGIPIISHYLDKPTSITDESVILESLIKPINIKRIYVDRAHAAEAKRVVRELLAASEG